jgi:hypothetical protein
MALSEEESLELTKGRDGLVFEDPPPYVPTKDDGSSIGEVQAMHCARGGTRKTPHPVDHRTGLSRHPSPNGWRDGDAPELHR